MIEGEEIVARDILVPRDSLEVRAVDYKPVPFDRERLDGIPAPDYDTLTIYTHLTRATISLPLEQLDDLIFALAELKRRLPAQTR